MVARGRHWQTGKRGPVWEEPDCELFPKAFRQGHGARVVFVVALPFGRVS